MEDLQNLKYKELQKLAKDAGIKAKGPKAELLNALIALNNGNEGETEDETKEKPKDADARIKSTKKGKNPVTDEDDNGNEGENKDETKKKPKGARSKSTKKGKNPVTDEDDMYLLISSTGPATDHMCDTFGLYRKTEEMKEGRHVYKQEHDSNDYETEDYTYKLISDNGVWVVSRRSRGEDLKLKATRPSELPVSVKWKYHYKDDEFDWRNRYEEDEDDMDPQWFDDPALTVTSVSEKKPSCECEVIISLSQDKHEDEGSEDDEDEEVDNPEAIKEMAGVYRANGSYHEGRPVLQHSGGRFTLFVEEGRWSLGEDSGDNGGGDGNTLESGSAPSQCPADPKAAIGCEGWGRKGQTSWEYNGIQAKGISIKCNKCIHNVDMANKEINKMAKKIRELERTIKTMNAKIQAQN